VEAHTTTSLKPMRPEVKCDTAGKVYHALEGTMYIYIYIYTNIHRYILNFRFSRHES
jgi:hypothetical protein